MSFFHIFFLKKANFEIKNKHFLDTSPGYESVPKGTHPDQEGWPQSDNTISRKKGKSDFKMACFLTNKGQAALLYELPLPSPHPLAIIQRET